MADFALTQQNFANIFATKTYHAIVDLDVMVQSKDSDNTEVIPLHRMIKSLNIFNLYHDCYFPICTVKLTIPQSIHELIVDNIDNTTFRLNVDLVENMTPDMIADFEDQRQGFMAKSIIKDMIMVPNDFDKTKHANEKETKANDDFKGIHNIVIDIDLLSKTHLEMQQKLYSGIYEQCNLNDLTLKLFNELKQKMLVHPINNQALIPEVILPNKNICQTIKYLQKSYGLYEKGLRLFFDYNRGYCLSNDVKENEILSDETKNEYKSTLIYLGRNINEFCGCYDDAGTQMSYIVAPNPHNFKAKDKSINFTEGANILVQYFDKEKEKIQNQISLNNDKIIESTKKVSKEIERINKQYQDKIKEIESVKNNIDSTVQKYINRINNSISNANNMVIKEITKGTSTLNSSLKNAASKTITSSIGNIKTGNSTLNKINAEATKHANAIINNNIDKMTNMINNMATSQLNKLTNGISSQLNQNSQMVYRQLGGKYNLNYNNMKNLANKEMGILKDVNKVLSNPLGSLAQSITKNTGGLGSFINDALMKKQRIIYQKYANKFMEKTKDAESSLEFMNMNIVAKNIDPSMLTINKYVRIAFLDGNYQEYKGAYQVVDLIWSFSPVSPHIHETTCTFKVAKLIKGELANQ